MTDEHACDTPPTGLPGDVWTCPECRQQWWADDLEAEDAVLICWRKVAE